MKKTKYLTSLIALGVIVTPIAILTSCNKNTSHFDDIPTEKKEKTSEQGSFTCTYSFDLHNELQTGQSIKVTLTKTSGSEGANVELTKDPEVKGKTLSFETTLKFNSNDTTFYCVFDVNVTCVDSSSKSVWEEKLTNFKHTVKSEKHDITAISKVSNVVASVDTTFITESTPVVLTINNSRTTTVNDASLTVKVNEQHVNIAIPLENGIIPIGSSTITYTKETVQALFPSYVITGTDSISFYIVRSGKYEVKEHRLYQFDDFGESSLVTEEAIASLDKKLLVLDSTNNELHLSDKTYSNFILSLTDDATIYLIHGNYYFNNSTGPSKQIRLTIHGICNSDGVSYADIQGYNPEVEAAETLVSYGNVELNLFNVNVLGRPNDGSKAWVADDSTGIIATPKQVEGEETNYVEVTATNCAFSGAYMLSYHHSIYNNCTFDSTNSLKPASGGYKNNYPMYIYSGSSAEFHGCKFKSAGKAVKIFTHGQGAGSVITTNTFENCEFNLVDSPWCVEQEFPINIDSTNFTITGVNVNILNCTMNQKWIDTKGNSLYGITDTSTGGYYDHIKINGQPVPVPSNTIN